MSPRPSRWRRPRSSPRSCTRTRPASPLYATSSASWGCRSVTQPDLKAAIVQDAQSGRVLMLAWMDDQALRLTKETGEAHFWSRSRQRLWRKGETSGNTLAGVELQDDCAGGASAARG